MPADGEAPLSATRAWAQARLTEALTAGDLARHASTSERTLARRFLSETGTTPLRWLVAQRVDVARELLEHTTVGVDEVARRSGLGSAENLRLHFRRLLRTTATAYRRAFAAR